MLMDFIEEVESSIRENRLIRAYDHEAEERKAIREFGREEGLEEGYEQGLEHGLEQGISLSEANIICNMIIQDLDPHIISKYTGISMNKIGEMYPNAIEKEEVLMDFSKVVDKVIRESRRFRSHDREEERTAIREYGHKEGLEEGKEEGIEIGLEQGINMGIKLNTKNIISNMLSKGYKPKEIAECTGKPIEFIKDFM